MRKKYLICCLALLAFSFAAYGQSNRTTAKQKECVSRLCQIMRAERDYNRAFLAPTETLIDELHTDDFQTTSEIPARTTAKTDILGYVMEFGEKIRAVTGVYTLNLRVRFYGPTAVTTGLWRTVAKTETGKEIIKNERFTRVWVREKGRWRLAASHYSPTLDPMQQK
jgi:ketosteroid isomerase-like protein